MVVVATIAVVFIFRRWAHRRGRSVFQISGTHAKSAKQQTHNNSWTGTVSSGDGHSATPESSPRPGDYDDIEGGVVFPEDVSPPADPIEERGESRGGERWLGSPSEHQVRMRSRAPRAC